MQALASIEEELDAVARKQRSIYRASLEMSPDERFSRLYDVLKWEKWLRAAAEHVLRSRGSRTAGVDRVTVQEFRGDLEHYLAELLVELREGTYRPMPVKRVYIPKGKGRLRPLGIPTLKDRVVQKAVQMILDPIYEALFEDCSHGFRAHRCTMDAMQDARNYLRQQSKYEWVIEGDIRDCFGSIEHKVLLRLLRRRIADKRLLTLITRMLKAGVLEELVYQKTEQGTPQGGIVSPLLANVVLHEFDRWFAARFHHMRPTERARRFKQGVPSCHLIRYADDFIIAVRGTETQAHAIKDEVAQFLSRELHLELNEEKTLVTHIGQGIDFLGFHLRQATRAKDGGKGLYIFPNKKAIVAYKSKVRALTHRQNVGLRPLEETILRINWVVRGWGNYFRYVNSKRTFDYLEDWTWHRVFNMLCQRHPKVGRKKVYQLYTTPNSEALLERHRKGRYRTIGVPVPGTDKRLLVEKMDAIAIRRYVRRKTGSSSYADTGIRLPWNPEVESIWEVRTDILPKDPMYEAIREDVLRRDKNRCCLCGSTIELEVHHRVARAEWARGGRGEGRVNTLENLTTLCHQCHRAQHQPSR
jgi:RNA-directed DNA polymerase